MEGCVVRLHSVQFLDNLIAQPIIINFHNLIQTRDAPETLTGIKNEDVFRAVVALLDMSLPDVGLRDIHDTVQFPGIHTIILTRDHADVLEDYRRRLCSNKRAVSSPVPCKTTKGDDPTHNMLAELYSDYEESAEDVQEAETSYRWSWEKFLEDLPEFVDKARDRKEKRTVQQADGNIPSSAIGAESVIIAAACYEIKIMASEETVLQLSLLAVRKRYWHLGIGSYIMELLKTQSVVGQYDALVAHSDAGAASFFKRHGFCDDLLLNDMFKELKNDWPNSILLSYLPPFTTDLEMRNPGFALSLHELEEDLDMSRSQALGVYQQQVVCVTRLLKEVKTLRRQLDQQREEVSCLSKKLDIEKQIRHDLEHKFMMYRLMNTHKLLDSTALDSDDEEQANQEHSKAEGQEEEAAQSEETLIPTVEGPEGFQ